MAQLGHYHVAATRQVQKSKFFGYDRLLIKFEEGEFSFFDNFKK